MISRWDLFQEGDFLKVLYTNLQTGQSMECGETDDSRQVLFDWMQQSAPGPAIVWMNNEIVGLW